MMYRVARFNRRGQYLMSRALVYAGIGIGYILTPDNPERVFGWLPHLFTLDRLGYVWLAATVMAIVAAIVARPPWEAIGFQFVTILPFLWACLWMISWGTGYTSTGWISAVIFAGYAYGARVVTAWPDPAPVEDLTLPAIPPPPHLEAKE